jgi:hypothetical protein
MSFSTLQNNISKVPPQSIRISWKSTIDNVAAILIFLDVYSSKKNLKLYNLDRCSQIFIDCGQTNDRRQQSLGFTVFGTFVNLYNLKI